MQNLMPPVNTPGNVFDDGDPSTGFPGSVVPAQWLNDVQFSIRDLQQECKNILASAGITPDPKKQQQLAEAIRKLIQNNVPNASTTTPGIVKLSNVINSNSDTQAATSQAVKTVFEMVSAANRDATTANNNANIRLEKRLNGADIPDKAAFVSNVGAYPKTGGVISGEVICQRVTIEADTPYLTAFDTNGTRQFFCGRAGDGPLYFKNDTSDATLRVTDVFHFNRQIIPSDYSNFDQRYHIQGEIRLFPFRPNELPAGWYHCNGDKHLITSAIGKALIQLSGNYKSDFRITISSGHINLPNFYSEGRGLFLRPSTSPGQIVPDTFRAHAHPDVVSNVDGKRIVNYEGDVAVAWFRSVSKRSPGKIQLEGTTGGAETTPIHIGMTPAIFLGV